MGIDTRFLTPTYAEAFFALRREALAAEPLAFASSPEDDVASSVAAVREMLGRPGQCVIGAFDLELVGVVGVYRDRHLKMAHKAHIWGMYVRPSHRGRGVGRRLMEAAIAFAGGQPGVELIHLNVAETAMRAAQLYESLGFVTWGIEPDATRAGGRAVAQRHMVLTLTVD